MIWELKKFNELNIHQLYEILKVRVDVFVVEQQCPYPEVDGYDPLAYHLFCEEDGMIMAYLRILPKDTLYKQVAFGRVLVKKECRGKGLAKELIERAISFINQDLQENMIKIQAQEYLKEFYSSFGFVPVSDVYLEDDIPHVDMLKS